MVKYMVQMMGVICDCTIIKRKGLSKFGARLAAHVPIFAKGLAERKCRD